MQNTMNAESAFGHRALASLVVCVYGMIVATSVMRHGDRHKTRHMTMRAVSLLRDAARSSLRADRDGADATDAYADAARARIYIAAVERLLSAEDVAHLSGISLDKMREYVDEQLSRTRSQLPREEDAATPAPAPAANQSRRPTVEGWQSLYAPTYLDRYAQDASAPAAKVKRSRW
ncbi:hypothetical protein JKP88DRAFT_289569 [Tribonema minus]|uniref:Uncharacterized protein n=1 Tax=Tribonema minus TaxID=303371 RepID=A0A836CH76_9STRA|nr:hypothetical protein JKP88DRAFT_289569 [Tribonema minus]